MAAKFRKVDPRIWNDERFSLLDTNGRLLALWLLTSSRVNRCGIVIWSPGLASEETGIPRDEIDTVYHRVSDTLAWVRDATSKALFLARWWRYNVPDNEKALKGALSDLHDIPKNGLKPALLRACDDIPKAYQQVYRRVLDTVYDTVSPQEKEKEKEKEQDKRPPNPPQPGGEVEPGKAGADAPSKTGAEDPPEDPPAKPPAGQKTATPRKPRSEPTHTHGIAIAEWCKAWESRYPEAGKYPFDGSADAKRMQFLLDQCGQDLGRLRPIFARYLADDSPYHGAAERHPLEKLRKNFTRWYAGGQPQPAPKPAGQFKSAAERNHDNLLDQAKNFFNPPIPGE